jgi:VIT1/CCC1 family predicted Fe2+/Mn2+ transporter
MFNINKFSLGATSAIITSLALIAGMTHDDKTKISLIAGLLIIAIADNVTDSLGIHILKESEGVSRKKVWISTIGNFTSRLILSLTFTLIVWLFPSYLALIISIIWGSIVLIILSYSIAKKQNTRPLREIFLHLFIAFFVIAGSKILGDLIVKNIAT